jgi:hypothetical protein
MNLVAHTCCVVARDPPQLTDPPQVRPYRRLNFVKIPSCLGVIFKLPSQKGEFRRFSVWLAILLLLTTHLYAGTITGQIQTATRLPAGVPKSPENPCAQVIASVSSSNSRS